MPVKTPVCSQYFDDTCNVFSVQTDLRGHPEISREALYSSILCHVFNMSNTPLNIIYGLSQQGRYKFQFPLEFSGSDVLVKEHYIITWDDNGISRKLQIETVSNLDSHIEAEAVEVNVS